MKSGRMIIAAVLLTLAMATSRNGWWALLTPWLCLFGIALIVDAASAARHGMPWHRPDAACVHCRKDARTLLDQVP